MQARNIVFYHVVISIVLQWLCFTTIMFLLVINFKEKNDNSAAYAVIMPLMLYSN